MHFSFTTFLILTQSLLLLISGQNCFADSVNGGRQDASKAIEVKGADAVWMSQKMITLLNLRRSIDEKRIQALNINCIYHLDKDLNIEPAVCTLIDGVFESDSGQLESPLIIVKEDEDAKFLIQLLKRHHISESLVNGFGRVRASSLECVRSSDAEPFDGAVRCQILQE